MRGLLPTGQGFAGEYTSPLCTADSLAKAAPSRTPDPVERRRATLPNLAQPSLKSGCAVSTLKVSTVGYRNR
jgi:hypothetical protein